MNLLHGITGSTRVYAIIGHPVKHSFSPSMHNAAFQHMRLDAVYVPFSVAPENLPLAIACLKALNIAGLNVTVPHKTKVLAYLDEITITARRIGAVNTIKIEDGRTLGTNTDGVGFIRSLEAFPFQPEGKTVVILGAGGAARGILVALAEAGASRIIVINRTQGKAVQLVETFADVFPETQLQALTLEQLTALSVDLLINTTTVGMEDHRSPLEGTHLGNVALVADIIYNPAQTPLMEQAQSLNIPTINGMGMLLYQGCAAFEFWTNQPAPVEIMKTQL
ncbi:shikimate dehydrogenase [Deltaproteobacteria bacterium TL4]